MSIGTTTGSAFDVAALPPITASLPTPGYTPGPFDVFNTGYGPLDRILGTAYQLKYTDVTLDIAQQKAEQDALRNASARTTNPGYTPMEPMPGNAVTASGAGFMLSRENLFLIGAVALVGAVVMVFR